MDGTIRLGERVGVNVKQEQKALTDLQSLIRYRWRVTLSLSAVMIAAYFSFIWILARHKEWLGGEVVEGLPVGIPLGVSLIVLASLLTGVYVRWANRVYDRKVDEIRSRM